jgi:hypothetical protein
MTASPQQGIAVPRGPADRGGDHRGHAPDPRRSTRLQAARDDRRAVARRATYSGSPRARRARPRPRARVAAGAQRQGRPAPRDRHGYLGLGAAATVGRGAGREPMGALFCVIAGPTRGRPWSSANVRVELRRLAAQAGVRRRFAPHQMRHAHARSSSRARASHSTSSSASSATPTSARPASTCRASTPKRSSPPCTPARADDVRHRGPASLSDPKTATAGTAQPLPLPARGLTHSLMAKCRSHPRSTSDS